MSIICECENTEEYYFLSAGLECRLGAHNGRTEVIGRVGDKSVSYNLKYTKEIRRRRQLKVIEWVMEGYQLKGYVLQSYVLGEYCKSSDGMYVKSELERSWRVVFCDITEELCQRKRRIPSRSDENVSFSQQKLNLLLIQWIYERRQVHSLRRRS